MNLFSVLNYRIFKIYCVIKFRNVFWRLFTGSLEQLAGWVAPPSAPTLIGQCGAGLKECSRGAARERRATSVSSPALNCRLETGPTRIGRLYRRDGDRHNVIGKHTDPLRPSRWSLSQLAVRLTEIASRWGGGGQPAATPTCSVRPDVSPGSATVGRVHLKIVRTVKRFGCTTMSQNIKVLWSTTASLRCSLQFLESRSVSWFRNPRWLLVGGQPPGCFSEMFCPLIITKWEAALRTKSKAACEFQIKWHKNVLRPGWIRVRTCSQFYKLTVWVSWQEETRSSSR